MPRTIKEIRPTVDSSDDMGITLNMGDGTFLTYTWEQIQDASQGGMVPNSMLIANIGLDLAISGISPSNRASVIQHFNGNNKYKIFEGNLTLAAASTPATGRTSS